MDSVSPYQICKCGNPSYVLVDDKPLCLICYGKLRNNDYLVEMGIASYGRPKTPDPQEQYDNGIQ